MAPVIMVKLWTALLVENTIMPVTTVASADQRNQNSASGAIYLPMAGFNSARQSGNGRNLHQVEIIKQPDPGDAGDHMQECEERPEIAPSQICRMVKEEKQKHEAGAESQRAVGFFKNGREFFEDVRSGFRSGDR